MYRPLLEVGKVLAEVTDPVNGWASASEVSGNINSSFNRPAQLIECLRSAEAVTYVNKGAWSMHELLMAALSISGTAHVWISSYALSETAARCLAQLKDSKTIRSINLVIDSRVEVRTAGSLQLLKSISDQIVLCDCHAKVTLLDGDIPITIVGSANYTENKRYETGFITKCPSVLDFHRTWIQGAITANGNQF